MKLSLLIRSFFFIVLYALSLNGMLTVKQIRESLPNESNGHTDEGLQLLIACLQKPNSPCDHPFIETNDSLLKILSDAYVVLKEQGKSDSDAIKTINEEFCAPYFTESLYLNHTPAQLKKQTNCLLAALVKIATQTSHR